MKVYTILDEDYEPKWSTTNEELATHVYHGILRGSEYFSLSVMDTTDDLPEMWYRIYLDHETSAKDLTEEEVYEYMSVYFREHRAAEMYEVSNRGITVEGPTYEYVMSKIIELQDPDTVSPKKFKANPTHDKSTCKFCKEGK